MRRITSVWLLVAALSGCLSAEQVSSVAGGRPGGGCPGHSGVSSPGPGIPGFQGPWGQPVAAMAPYNTAMSEGEARALMSHSLPLSMVEFSGAPPGAAAGMARTGFVQPAGMSGLPGPMNAPGIEQTGGSCPPGGCPKPPGAVAAIGALTGGGPQRFPTKRTSVRFLSPAGMKISWYAPTCDGKTGFSNTQIEAPGRYNFVQAAIYRLKISDIPNRPGLELYPTLEVVPSNCKTDPFLAHSSVPISFTDEDFDQVASGNFVVKVIYLPDPQFQDLATTGPDEVVSSRLEPGVDPIAEAHRRGSILLIIRIGNIDLEAPNTPPMDAPSPYQPKPMMVPHAMMAPQEGGPGMMPPNMMMGQGNPMIPPSMMMGQGQSGPMMAPKGAVMGQNVSRGPNGTFMIMGPNGPVMVGPNGPIAMPSQKRGSAAPGNPATQPGAMLPPSMPSAPVATPPAAMPQAPPAPTGASSPSTKADKPTADVLQAKVQPAISQATTPEIQQAGFQTTAALASQAKGSTKSEVKKPAKSDNHDKDDKGDKKKPEKSFWSSIFK